MLRRIAAAAAAFSLVGCATQSSFYRPQISAVNEPAIDAEVTVPVGERMLTQGMFVRQDGFSLLASFKPSWAYTLSVGDYVKTGDGDLGEFFMPKFNSTGGGSVEKALLADPWKALLLRKDGQLCVVTVFSAYTCDSNPPLVRKTFNTVTEQSFQQTLIYSGRVGNKINIGYREFTSDMARMAFNNNVEYDLTESTTIGYRGAEIEVIEATNRSIKYKVKRYFSAVR
ncbi:hypothetical protein [Roseateles sp.]|uniref:hypothetical protein n=1 Tax=Roseateles sp. TaxID=1971397 RepID=UPI0031D46758